MFLKVPLNQKVMCSHCSGKIILQPFSMVFMNFTLEISPKMIQKWKWPILTLKVCWRLDLDGSQIQVPMFRFRWVWVWDLSFQGTFSALTSAGWQWNSRNWAEGQGREGLRGSQIQTLSFTSTGFALLPSAVSGDFSLPYLVCIQALAKSALSQGLKQMLRGTADLFCSLNLQQWSFFFPFFLVFSSFIPHFYFFFANSF